MEILGIGVDIESIARFRRKPYRRNREFYDKVFSQREVNYCLKKADSYASLAGKFCAKEAVLKALQKNNLFSLSQIEIINDTNGQPRALQNGRKLKCLLSIAHGDAWAVAFCIAYK